MKPLVKHFALLILLSGLQIHYLSAQILIQSNPDLDSLVKRIVGDLSYANPTYQGKDIAKAMFENGESTNLGLDRGIILCTGNPDYIPGPNDDCYVFNNWNEPGHPPPISRNKFHQQLTGHFVFHPSLIQNWMTPTSVHPSD